MYRTAKSGEGIQCRLAEDAEMRLDSRQLCKSSRRGECIQIQRIVTNCNCRHTRGGLCRGDDAKRNVGQRERRVLGDLKPRRHDVLRYPGSSITRAKGWRTREIPLYQKKAPFCLFLPFCDFRPDPVTAELPRPPPAGHSASSPQSSFWILRNPAIRRGYF